MCLFRGLAALLRLRLRLVPFHGQRAALYGIVMRTHDGDHRRTGVDALPNRIEMLTPMQDFRALRSG